MEWKPPTEEELRLLKLQAPINQLLALQARHETLGLAYREACSELEQLRMENVSFRRRLVSIHALCTKTSTSIEGLRHILNDLSKLP